MTDVTLEAPLAEVSAVAIFPSGIYDKIPLATVSAAAINPSGLYVGADLDRSPYRPPVTAMRGWRIAVGPPVVGLPPVAAATTAGVAPLVTVSETSLALTGYPTAEAVSLDPSVATNFALALDIVTAAADAPTAEFTLSEVLDIAMASATAATGNVLATLTPGAFSASTASAATVAPTVAVSVGPGQVTANAATFNPTVPELTTFTTAGTYNYTVPAWANKVDIIVIGGGAGGGPGVFAGSGDGGKAATWATKTIVRGVDFFGTGTFIFTIGVGAGGLGGLATRARTDGSNSTAYSGGTTFATGGGGVGTMVGQFGGSPGNKTYNGNTYIGGSGGSTTGASGTAPGAGGAGGVGLYADRPGGDGGAGRAFLLAYV